MPDSNQQHDSSKRRLSFGAELVPQGAHFRVWAPLRKSVLVLIDGQDPLKLDRDEDGFFTGIATGAKAGDRYRFKLDEESLLLPDPASRFQPNGVHEASEIVDPTSFKWTDAQWLGVHADDQVIYELHIGTFTPEGTYTAADEQLEELKRIGITCIEILPVADFAGNFGWGYDGVCQFAPTRLYGRPDELRAFVDRAHAIGLGVILDVVYNHFGPDGNYLSLFAKHFVADKHKTDWGEAVNFDGERSEVVRQFFLDNIRYWIEEFHFDGFRFDAVHAMLDDSPTHILADISRVARETAGDRGVYLVAEDEMQRGIIARKPPVGYGFDGSWNDDFQHSARVRLSGYREAYYADYKGSPREFIAAARYGYLYQGQYSINRKKNYGTHAMDLPATAFVNCLENHDQVAHTATGGRLHTFTSPANLRAMTALWLLMPQTPMFFQGQEFGSSKPFLYFADHNPQLSKLVCKGRREFLNMFPSIAALPPKDALDDPGEKATFTKCKLDFSERMSHALIYQMHQDLLAMRNSDAFKSARKHKAVDGAVLSPDALVLRFFADDKQDRLLLVNFGIDFALDINPEPLLAPLSGCDWELCFSSEDPNYGGGGTPPVLVDGSWRLHGRSAVVMKPTATNKA